MEASKDLTETEIYYLAELSGHPGWKVFVRQFEQKVQDMINTFGDTDGLKAEETHLMYKEIRALRNIQREVLTLPSEMAAKVDVLDPLRP